MLTSKHTQLENEVIKHILDRENFPRFRFFMQMRMADLLSTVQLTFRLLISLIRNKDIEDMQFYFRRLANYLFVGGFDINEIRNYIQTTESVLIDNLKCNPDCREFYNETINYLSPVFQLLIDETEEYYEKLKVTQLKKSNSEDIYINNFEVKDHYPIKRTVPDQSISFKSMQFDNLPSFSIN
jgi:hypothetical protein